MAAQQAQEPPKETPQERMLRLLAKVKVVRERMLFQMGEVRNGTPGFTYIWVTNDNQLRVRFHTMGYEQVTKGTDPDVVTDWKREDGTHLRGDVLLYRIPTDYHDAIKLEAQIRSKEALETTKDTFLGFAAREHIPARELRG